MRGWIGEFHVEGVRCRRLAVVFIGIEEHLEEWVDMRLELGFGNPAGAAFDAGVEGAAGDFGVIDEGEDAHTGGVIGGKGVVSDDLHRAQVEAGLFFALARQRLAWMFVPAHKAAWKGEGVEATFQHKETAILFGDNADAGKGRKIAHEYAVKQVEADTGHLF